MILKSFRKVLGRHAILALAQFCLFGVAVWLAFLLRFEFIIPGRYVKHLWWTLSVLPVVKLLVFHCYGLTSGWWRHVSTPDVLRVLAANVAASVAGALAALALGPAGFPRSLYVLDFGISLVLTEGVRIATRIVAETWRGTATCAVERTLIYGCGAAAAALLRESRANPAFGYSVRGFIDDDPSKRGLRVHGVRVLGSGRELPQIASKERIRRILIAIPSATGPQMAQILRHCQDAGVRFKTMPSLAEVIEGSAYATQIRDIAVEDLLGRAPVLLDIPQICAKLSGATVLVTGAGGSIGSELCRQIARFSPAAIVGLEIAESALFHVQREMSRSFPSIPFHAEIGSIKDRRRLAEVFETYRPDIVYHAAAYKHVPLMESHVFEAVENNVFGTLTVALAAVANGVGDFVMISSDKAVKPTNVMGATKRMAELVIRSLQNGRVKFVSVRFGNVLGSNGSVVPTFKEQIARGGPVTVTHPEMCRYFMTIPESCQLVLQASTMGQGGEIFVLDMGEPVRIVDLARNLILLSGFRPDEDIKIEFTGIRPGEKLYEELNLSDETTLPTPHHKIKIFAGNSVPHMDAYLQSLRKICETRDLPGLVLLLKEAVPDYNPSAPLLSRALSARAPTLHDHAREPRASRGFASANNAAALP